jgi:hypothetical protein
MILFAFVTGLVIGGVAGLIAYVCGELAEWAEDN